MQEEVLGLAMFEKEKYNQMKLEIDSLFKILNSNMENRFIYAMFSIYKVLEIIIYLYIEEKKENKQRFACWIKDGIKIKNFGKNHNDDNIPRITQNGDRNDSTENKIRIIMHEKLSLKDKDINNDIKNIVNIRNKTIHPDNGTQYKIDKDDILIWMKMLQQILENVSLEQS